MLLQTLASVILGISSIQELPRKVTHNDSCGQSTYYDNWYHGRQTSSGEIYSQYDMTAASRDYPNGTWLRVTNQRNNKTVEIKVNDTGNMPFLDLSEEAAVRLGSDGYPDNYSVCVAVL